MRTLNKNSNKKCLIWNLNLLIANNKVLQILSLISSKICFLKIWLHRREKRCHGFQQVYFSLISSYKFGLRKESIFATVPVGLKNYPHLSDEKICDTFSSDHFILS